MFRKIIILLACVILFISFAEASVLLDRVVAIVDRDIITWSELYKAMAFEYEANLASYSREEKRLFLESTFNTPFSNFKSKSIFLGL